MGANLYHVEVKAGPLTAIFHGEGRMPKCSPDPAYPNGKDADIAEGFPGCAIDLQHPTPCYGLWVIACERCGYTVAVTAAARPDDPAKITIPCQIGGHA